MAVWIDHDRALIVAIAPYGLIIERVRSEVEKRSRMAGGSRSRAAHGPQDVFDEPSREARREQQLRRYFRKVMRVLREAEEIYICGPGEAKTELRKALVADAWPADRIRAVESADKMTDRQFKARAVAVFARQRSRSRRRSA
jgi:ferredoxin-NADP reductase